MAEETVNENAPAEEVPSEVPEAPDKVTVTEDNAPEGESTEKTERTFTQAELDRIIAGRLSKYADYDQIKAERDQMLEQNMSDREREVAQARREAVAEANAAANARIVRAEAKGIAGEMDFSNVDLALRLVDLSNVSVDDNGDVDTDSIRDALQVVADEAPGLLKTRKGSLGAQGVGSGATPAVESDEALARRILKL